MLTLVLHNIRSAENVGSIFRTADATGVEKIYLVGYTPDPLDRFGRARKDVAKAALGAEKTIPWEHVSDIFPLIEKLKAEGREVVALEQAPNSIDYRAYNAGNPTAVIIGNEVDGVPFEVLKLADGILEIPMLGEKESLNVAVATGVLLYRLLDKK